jgi:hypothetical protein
MISKIHGNICKSRCTTGINCTGGKFATGNETSSKIAASINDTSGNLPLVSTTLAANLATSFASAVDTGGKFATGVNNTNIFPFATDVNDTGGAP